MKTLAKLGTRRNKTGYNERQKPTENQEFGRRSHAPRTEYLFSKVLARIQLGLQDFGEFIYFPKF